MVLGQRSGCNDNRPGSVVGGTCVVEGVLENGEGGIVEASQVEQQVHFQHPGCWACEDEGSGELNGCGQEWVGPAVNLLHVFVIVEEREVEVALAGGLFTQGCLLQPARPTRAVFVHGDVDVAGAAVPHI